MPLPGYLFVVPWELHHPGGVNQVVLNLHDQIAAGGTHRPEVLVNAWEYPALVERVVADRRTGYFSLRAPWLSTHPWGNAFKFLASLPRSLAVLARHCRRLRVEVVNMHYPSLAALQFVLLRALGLYRGRLVLSFHGADWREVADAQGIERRLWEIAIGLADAVVVCSCSMAEEVSKWSAACIGKVRVVHNGVDLRRLEAEGGGLGARELNNDWQWLVSVATFESKKGLDVLLRAFALVAQGSPELQLAIIGRSGPALQSLRELRTSLGLEERVVLMENVPHATVIGCLRKAAAFCLPSRIEPFGIAILEAGALRVPVVATRVGGIPEIVTDGITGRLVPADDVAALATALAELLASPQERDRLAENLHRRVRDEFTWQRACRQYLDAAGVA